MNNYKNVIQNSDEYFCITFYYGHSLCPVPQKSSIKKFFTEITTI
jgi:hypothetical protein